MPMRVIIDTDPGIDDAVALILAHRLPELEVLGVTTVAGNVAIESATANALKVLALIGAATPVYKGWPGPLERPLPRRDNPHGADGLGGQPLPDPPNGPQPVPAVDFLLAEADRWQGELTVIALGPLTNLGAAFRRAPEVMGRLGRIVWMGGAYTVPGNVTPVAEFNASVDPEAARTVLQGGLPLTLIGLDVTLQALFGPAEVAALCGKEGPVAAFLGGALAHVLQRYQEYGHAGCAIHDALAVAAAARPALVALTPMAVDVEVSGELTAGMTVADRRPRAHKAPNAEVALGVDAAAYRALLQAEL